MTHTLDQALREEIAREIEAEMRRHDNTQIGFSAVGDAYARAAEHFYSVLAALLNGLPEEAGR